MKWLKRTQAFALFALAAFVNFSIAGSHISLGLLVVCVIARYLIVVRSGPSEAGDLSTTRDGEILPANSALQLGFEWPILAFVLANLLSTLLSEVPWESFRNSRNLLTISGAYAVAYTLRLNPTWRRPLLWTFVSVAAAASVYGLGAWAFGVVEKVQSLQSTTMTWGALSVLFALVTAQLAFAGSTRRERWAGRLMLIPQLLAMLFSMVRGAYVGFAAGVMYLMKRHWRRALPVLVVLIAVAALAAPASLRQRITSIFDLKVTTTQVRLVQWQYALEVFRDHPFFGVGWRDLAAITRSYAPPHTDFVAGINRDVFHIGHYHSTYFTLLACLGGIGMAAFIWLMLAVWKSLGMIFRKTAGGAEQGVVFACQAAWIGFLVSGLFDWTFGDAEVVTMLWFLTGLGLGQAADSTTPATTTKAV